MISASAIVLFSLYVAAHCFKSGLTPYLQIKMGNSTQPIFNIPNNTRSFNETTLYLVQFNSKCSPLHLPSYNIVLLMSNCTHDLHQLRSKHGNVIGFIVPASLYQDGPYKDFLIKVEDKDMENLMMQCQQENNCIISSRNVNSDYGSTGTDNDSKDDSGSMVSRNSVLFVAVSFILLMIISLTWLVFYYVQRFRYIHSKERVSRRLADLAKKAVARIPVKTLKPGDKVSPQATDSVGTAVHFPSMPFAHRLPSFFVRRWARKSTSAPSASRSTGLLTLFASSPVGESLRSK
ncbi:hypothetical protein Ciccas_011683 [Cichlidogyrus casuarinus]|uniref:Uncharacterized protein n=1 Tax=Cichlidogyrus casuarinus TaxID=1844966 RepID=A0ABD2PQJ6_9PLAT